MHLGPGGLRGNIERLLQLGADWLAERDVRDNAFAEEGIDGAALGAVEDWSGRTTSPGA